MTTPAPRRRTNRLTVDLKDLHDPWLDWCQRHDRTPSEALRQIISAAVQDAPLYNLRPRSDPGDTSNRTQRHRVEIRLTTKEYLAVVAAAGREGFSVPRWLTALVHLRLTGEEPLGQNEVEALARSNQLLLSLGRSINQIAFNMNASLHTNELTLAQLCFVSNFLKAHIEATSAVLQANHKRWQR